MVMMVPHDCNNSRISDINDKVTVNSACIANGRYGANSAQVLVIVLTLLAFLGGALPAYSASTSSTGTNTGTNASTSAPGTSSTNAAGSELRQRAIQDYKILFAPPNGNAAASTWLVDIGPAADEANTDAVKRAKRDYASKHIPGGQIQGQHRPRDVVWKSRAGSVAGGASGSRATATGAATSSSATANRPASGSSGVDYGY